MENNINKTMRDTLFDELYFAMDGNDKIYLITADFGAPMLDKIREKFPSRVINVGIAEQNAINVAAGLALEKNIVFVYGIAPFISMRPFEQLRINLSALSQLKEINVNIIGVGAGVSYSVSGPTHHCLEDISIVKTLPNFEVFSPSDSYLVKKYFPNIMAKPHPKYLRFDAQNLPSLCGEIESPDDGFRVIDNYHLNRKVVVVATGFMSHKAYLLLKKHCFSLVDLYCLCYYDRKKLSDYLNKFDSIVTLEEGFIGAGGLDSEINSFIRGRRIINMGFPKKYTFEIGEREFIHSVNGVGVDDIQKILKREMA